MELIDPSFFILGLVLASAVGDETTTNSGPTVTWEFDRQMFDGNNYNATTEIPSTNTTINITTSMSTITSNMNITDTINSTTMPSTTNQKGVETTKGGKDLTTREPIGPFRTISANDKERDKTTISRSQTPGNTTAIVIIVIILIALVLGVAFYITRHRGRRYSVDFTSRQDEANIPLSIVDPELPADAVSQNGLQTFENLETAKKEPQEAEAKPEVQEEQTTEADGSVAEPGAESAAAPADVSEDKPKEDVVGQSPPAPVQPSGEEKTDDEGDVSNETSVESLKETNENNSNNADSGQKRDLRSSESFWDVPLNCPV